MERDEAANVSRRQMLGCITNGLVAVVAAPALAQHASDREATRRVRASVRRNRRDRGTVNALLTGRSTCSTAMIIRSTKRVAKRACCSSLAI